MVSGLEFTPEEVTQKKAEMIKWVKESCNGTFSEAFVWGGISRSLGYEWFIEDHQFKIDMHKARVDAVESGVDFAENKLIQLISEGNVTATLFFLKCQAKHRGYIDKVIISGDPENPLTVNHVHRATEDLRSVLTAIADRKAGSGVVPLTLDQESSPEPDNPIRELARLAGNGGPGLGQDTDGR